MSSLDPFTQPISQVKDNHRPIIDPVQLYQLLNDVKTADVVLVLDTRSKKEFASCRINYPCCINIPDDLLRTRY